MDSQHETSAVLLVEDEPIVQKIHMHMLKQAGCVVDLAKDAYQALALLLSKRYDVIFMDIGLPGMSGVTASAEIRRLEGSQKATPIIALTAYDQDEIKAECMAAGIDKIVTKPVNFVTLQLLLKQAEAKTFTNV